MTDSDGGKVECSVVRANVLEAFSFVSSRKNHHTHHVPTSILDILQLILDNDAPDALGNVGTVLECQVQLDLVVRLICEFNDAANDLVCVLQKVMAGTQRDGGV